MKLIRRLLGTLAGALLAVILLNGLAFAASDTVCAVVKIEILQELTFERQGFEATLRVTNGLAATPLSDFHVDLGYLDADGNLVSATENTEMGDALFFQRSLSGLTASGTTVAGGESRALKWLIVPTFGAGGTDGQGRAYYVGATVTYKVNGVEERVEVAPDYIWVMPMPKLSLEYFLPEAVNGDDPMTAAVVEPAEPFPLGVRVINAGHGVARSLKIESAQPRIVENLQGLAVGFQLLGAEVNGKPATASLLADFGDVVGGGGIGMARWKMAGKLGVRRQ